MLAVMLVSVGRPRIILGVCASVRQKNRIDKKVKKTLFVDVVKFIADSDFLNLV